VLVLFSACLVFFRATAPPVLQIRFCNATGGNLELIGEAGSLQLAPGMYSGWKGVAHAYPEVSVRGRVDGRYYETVFDDYVGAVPLDSGRHTYSVMLDDTGSRASLHAVLSSEGLCSRRAAE